MRRLNLFVNDNRIQGSETKEVPNQKSGNGFTSLLSRIVEQRQTHVFLLLRKKTKYCHEKFFTNYKL